MKKLHTLSITLLIAAFIAASVGLNAETITSVQDGDWKLEITWVGGVVPTAVDSVVVQHLVDIFNGDSCMHLYIAPSGTLQNQVNATRTLVVNGNMYNDGTVAYTNNKLNIKLNGNLHLNGIWDSPSVFFTGTSMQVISASPGKVFEATRSGIEFEDIDPASTLRFATDLKFIDIEFVMNGSTLEFAPGIEVAVYGEEIDNANIIGNNSGLMLRDGAYVKDCYLGNLTIKGTFNLASGNSSSGELINADTMQNLVNATRILEVNGNFTNNGIIRETNNNLHFKFRGNVTNNGLWKSSDIFFDGAVDQHVASTPGAYIYCDIIEDLDIGSKIILDSDWEIHDATIDLNHATLEASGAKIILRQNAYIEKAVVDMAFLGGEFNCYSNCVFTGTTTVIDTLQNRSVSALIAVTFDGDLINNGIIRRSNTYALNLFLNAGFESNGPVDVESMTFSGSSDQIIFSTVKNGVFDVDQVYDTDPASAIVLGSDITFVGAIIDLDGATINLENGNLTLEDGFIKNGMLFSESKYVRQTGSSRFANMQVSGTRLKGICQVYGNANTFINVTVDDTLQNYPASAYPVLTVNGDFVNNGVIKNSNSYRIKLHVEDNFYNYGSAYLYQCEFTGAGNQEFCSPGLPFLNAIFASSKSGGQVIAIDDILFEGCTIDLNNDVLNLQEADMKLTGGELTKVVVQGNGNKLIVSGDGVIENVDLTELYLEGKAYIHGVSNSFHNITLTDTISKKSTYYNNSHIYTTGNFINNGYITTEGSYGIYFYVSDTVINNGYWLSKKLFFNDADMHYIESQNANPFDVEDITISAKGGEVSVISDLYLLNTEVDFGDINLYLPDACIFNMDNSILADVNVIGGDFSTINCMNNSLFTSSTLNGAFISGTLDVETNTFIDCVIDGVMQNHDVYYNHTISFEGNVTNSGSIINRPSWSYNLRNSVLGNIYNYGTWEILENRWEGIVDQDIYLMDNSQINTPSEFYAMLGTGGYQWYKNNVLLDGETDDIFDFSAITVADRGYYHCETDEGTSRTLRICTPIGIDLADEAYFCQYESVMIEATALSGEGPYTYLWEPALGLSDPNISNPIANPVTPTEYTITVTDAIGCKGQASILVQQYPQLYVDAGADDEICYGLSTLLDGGASGGELDYVYEWSPADDLSNPNIANPSASPLATTIYTLTVTDGNGCMETDQVTLTVFPQLFADAGTDDEICYGLSTLLNGSASGGELDYAYEWTPTDGLSNPNIANPSASPEVTTNYTLTVTDGNGCVESDQMSITVHPLPIFTWELSDTVYCYGEDITFIEYFTGTAPWTVEGFINGQPDTFTCYESPTIFTMVASESFFWEPLTVTDGNGCTSTVNQQPVNITVHPLPTFTYELSDTEVCPGEEVTFTNYFTGTAPWTVEFMYNGVYDSFTTSDNPEYFTDVFTETTLYVPLSVTDANGCSSEVNQPNTIIVNPVPVAYEFTSYGPYCEEVPVDMIVAGSEVGVNYYLIRNNDPPAFMLEGTGNPLEFNFVPGDGTYTVNGVNTSTDCENMMTGSIVVEIDYPPVIVSQMPDDHRLIGTSKTWIADVTSTTPSTYYWHFEGDLVQSGPSNTYTKTNLTLDDTGEYWYVVQNDCGEEQSESMLFTVLDEQAVTIPEGWSGISTYLSIWDDDVDKIFQYIQGDLILVNDFVHMYWPGQNINTYEAGKWDTYTGAQIKLSAPATVDFQGLHIENKIAELKDEWTYMPVLHETPVPADELFMQKPDQIIMAKDIAGTGVYWPEHGINTLDMLDPGKAYLVNVTQSTEVDFGIFFKSTVASSHEFRPKNTSPWSNPVYSNSSHTIALPEEITNRVMVPGDWLGVTNADGVCCGIIEFDGTSTAITAFGDDPTTSAVDGLLVSEWMAFIAYRTTTGEMYDLHVEFDPSVGEQGYFSVNGLSVISNMKAEAISVGDAEQNQIRIYPNPTNGVVFIKGISIDSQIEITNTAGQIVYKTDAFGEQSINLGDQARGLYSIRITNEKFTTIRKVMVE